MSEGDARPDSNGKKPFFSSSALGIICALLATFIWSFNFVAGRGLAADAPPCTMAFFRWLIGFCAVLPLAYPALKREWRYFTAHWRYYLITSFIGVAYLNTAIYAGAHTVEALNMSLIAVSSPLYTVLLARIFFQEPLPLSRVFGICVAVGGVLVLLTRGEFGRLASLSFHGGDLLLLSAALSFSLYTLLVRKKPAGCGDLSYLAVTFGIGVLFLLPAMLFELSGGQALRITPRVVGGFLYMGLGASLLAFWLWSKAINAIGPSKTSMVYYCLPFFTGIEAVILLGEPLRWVHGVGGGLILGGVMFATRERADKKQP